MKLTLRSLAALLGYPSADLVANAGAIREALASEAVLPLKVLRRLESLLDALETEELLDLQSGYSELFDRARSLSLHLFEHVHGDSRERGQAMIDLAHQYKAKGCLLDSRELPDFVPVFLEFASCLPEHEARETLSEPIHVFAALTERLSARESPYAAIFGAVVALAETKPDGRAVAELHDKAPSDDLAHIDEEWEERAVTFTGADLDHSGAAGRGGGCSSESGTSRADAAQGIVARIRTIGRAKATRPNDRGVTP